MGTELTSPLILSTSVLASGTIKLCCFSLPVWECQMKVQPHHIFRLVFAIFQLMFMNPEMKCYIHWCEIWINLTTWQCQVAEQWMRNLVWKSSQCSPLFNLKWLAFFIFQTGILCRWTMEFSAIWYFPGGCFFQSVCNLCFCLDMHLILMTELCIILSRKDIIPTATKFLRHCQDHIQIICNIWMSVPYCNLLRENVLWL